MGTVSCQHWSDALFDHEGHMVSLAVNKASDQCFFDPPLAALGRLTGVCIHVEWTHARQGEKRTSVVASGCGPLQKPLQ